MADIEREPVLGIGHQIGPLAPRYGPDWAPLKCDVCDATWIGPIGEWCSYCTTWNEDAAANQPTPKPKLHNLLDQALHGNGDTPHPTMRDRLLTISQLRDLPPPTPLIDGIIDLDNFGILYGRRGSYKSFLALNWGLAIAAAVTWDGLPVTEGTVLYVVAEGVSGTYQRIDAWCQHRETQPPDRFHVLPESVNLLSPSSAAELADTAQALEANYIVIDTLARCMVGGDENAAKDAGIAVDSIDLIRRRTGAHILGVHHAGKDTKQGARGSSAFEAAADTVLEVTATEGRITLKQTKQKNRVEEPPRYLYALPTAGSVVIAPLEGHSSSALTKGELDAIAVLKEIEVFSGISLSTWIEAAADAGISRGVVTRARKKGIDLGAIELAEDCTQRQPRYITTEIDD